MEESQQQGRTDRELAAAGDQGAQLRVKVTDWLGSKGISRCPLCGQEDAWDVPGTGHVYPLAFSTVRAIGQAAQRSDTARIARAIQGNMRVSRLKRITCSNCRYALLLDDVKISEDTADPEDP